MSNENSTEKKKFDAKEFFGKVKNYFKTFNYKDFFREHLFELIAFGGFLLCLIIFSFLPQTLNGPKASFWRPIVIQSFIEQVTVYLILAMGACFIYLMGCMDISVGYQVGVFAAIFVIIVNATGSIFLALLTILSMGVVCAVFNAFVGAYVKLPQVMSSVILMQLFNGLLTMLFADSGMSSRAINLSLKLFDSTAVRVTTLVVLAVIAFYFINFTVIGKRSKAIGANKLAAQQAGANLLKTRILCYGLFAIFLCVAALFVIARKDGVSEADTTSYQMDIMIMLLMGGMPLSGGMKGKLSNCIIGTMTYVLLNLGLGLCRVPAEWIFFVRSAIFVLIVCLTCRKPGNLLPR